MTGLAPPLAGVRVLDLASLYAAPLVATLLADHGAEVVKVEPPGGDPYRQRPALWALVGRGKRSLALDWSTDDGADLIRRLVPHFDVVVENLPLRVSSGRGLSPQQLQAQHPSLVVVSASGFGHEGPYADRPANGTLGEAFAGLTHLTGESDGAPMLPSVPLGDAVAASFGAMGALAAVVRQRQSGQGGLVDLTVYEPLLHVLGPALSGFAAGVAPPQRDGGAMGVALRGTFRAADGGWVAMSCSTTRHEEAVAMLVEGSSEQPLRERARSWIAAHPAAQVLDAMVQARVPVVLVNDLAAVVEDPQVLARGSVRSSPYGPVATPVPRITGEEPALRYPRLGDANEQLLSEVLQLSPAVISELRQRGLTP